jgi:hypothetical protein
MPLRTSLLALLACLTLSGCVAGIAAGALGAAVRETRGEPKTYQNLDSAKLAASQACSARAAGHGEVRVIDIEHRGPSKLVVWGTATAAAGRQSFECTYTDQVTGFRLRRLDK